MDTHVLLWFLTDSPDLPSPVKRYIENTRNVYVSDATFWEIGIKGKNAKSGKAIRWGDLPLDSAGAISELVEACKAQGIQPRAMTTEVCCLAPFLDGAHKDPFDRMIAAQSLVPERLTLVSADEAFDQLSPDIQRYWR
ncbi:MAG TPA: type II toxin-antitoxin system VapC family toxin [Terriglobales bacterium]|nr:type II toxin-antitoxin system VapC family toxin [Terriglobales bacterium]